jgi:hypothetical protein
MNEALIAAMNLNEVAHADWMNPSNISDAWSDSWEIVRVSDGWEVSSIFFDDYDDAHNEPVHFHSAANVWAFINS